MTDFAHAVSERMPKLKRYARSLTRNEADADDLLQDCVERALTRQEQFRPGTNLDAWLVTIMRNIFINTKRHEKLVREHVTRERMAENRSEKPAQLDHMELRQVLAACRQLSRNHQTAIRLLCLDQVSYNEAARDMGVPVATAKTRLFRAREQLRMRYAA